MSCCRKCKMRCISKMKHWATILRLNNLLIYRPLYLLQDLKPENGSFHICPLVLFVSTAISFRSEMSQSVIFIKTILKIGVGCCISMLL